MSHDKEFEDALKFREQLFQIINGCGLELTQVNWAFCSVVANLLAAHPKYEEVQELFLQHILQEAAYLKENDSSAFTRETLN
jgi:hypothetical protein